MSQKIKLIDALDELGRILEDARIFAGVIASDFFGIDNTTKEGEGMILFYFKKYRAFAGALVDLLATMENFRPQSDWAETLNIVEPEEAQGEGVSPCLTK